MTVKMTIAVALQCCLATAAAGQNLDWAKTSVPKVLSISTETIKVGQGDVHQKVESGWRHAFDKAKFPSYFFGLSSLSGPSTMVFLTAYDSLQGWQREDEAQISNQWLWAEQDKLAIEDAAYLTAKTHEFAELLADLSVPVRFPFGAARCFAITRVEVEPAQQAEFRDWLRGQVKSSVLPHLATYRVMAGGSISSFILIEARTSRAAFDANNLPWESGVPGVKAITRNLFEPDPQTSRVSPDFAKGNEKFWFPTERN